MCFLREVYLHSGTELIPLFPYLRASLHKRGGCDGGIAPGNRLQATDHGLTGFPDLKVNPGLGRRLKFAITCEQIFGTSCFAYIQNQPKLEPRCKKGVFIGYDKSSPAYLVYFKSKNQVKRVRCVKFYDN